VSGGIRCFVALVLPAELRETVAAHFAREGQRVAGVRWVAAANLHLTLQFLGEVEAARIPAVREALDGAVPAHRPFRLGLRGAGAFPTPERPRVLWVGAGQGATETSALATSVAAALAPVGFASEERRFVPHLTVGRVASPPRDRGPLRRLLDAVRDREWGECLIPAAHLLRSELFPAGPIYSILHEARLPATARQG
jgi:RNA 2',3'-cyclic 3'-phosphodiesterase